MSKPTAGPKARPGYLYLSVLMVSLCVSVTAMATIAVVHGSRRATVDSAAWLRARSLADSAIAHGLACINSNSDWRTSYSHDVETSPRSVDGGSVAFKIVDEDGDLTDDPFDAAYLHGIGRSGNAVYVRRVQLEPDGDAIDSLECTLAVDGAFYPESTVYWAIDEPLYATGNVRLLYPTSRISGHLESSGSVWHDYRYSSSASYQTGRSFPSSNWPSYYDRQGTRIDINQIPLSGGYREISQVVLHKNDNPYGSTNLLGIYIIDCDGEDLRIKNARIEATLLIKNPGPNSRISGSVFWEPAVDNFPILLVQGDFRIAHDPSPLNEVTSGTNFNPPSLPYGATSDSDQTDEFPSRLKGLIYVDGELAISQSGNIRTEIEGVVICDEIEVLGDVQIMHRRELATNPPPGFRDGSRMKIVSGSWRRVAHE